jgi:hypothetical protein
MLTQSTFAISDTIKVLTSLWDKIDNGFINTLPIEQRINALYSGDIVINLIKSSDENTLSSEEICFIQNLQDLIYDELHSNTFNDWGLQ